MYLRTKLRVVALVLALFMVIATFASCGAGEAGAAGPKGDKGEQGAQGAQGEQGPKGDKGDKGDTGAAGPAGPAGPAGEMGPRGFDGDDGEDGIDGIDGKNGKDGLSAYQLAVANGFVGTEAEWLASLSKTGFFVRNSDELFAAAKVANAYIVLLNDIEIGISENFDPDPTVVIDYNGFELKQVIKTAAEFAAMEADGDYALGADITIDATWNGGVVLDREDLATYTPFKGSLDGQGYTITTNTAVFANVAGTVKNLIVDGDIAALTIDANLAAEATAIRYNGAVALYADGTAVFENIENYANVNATVAAAEVTVDTASVVSDFTGAIVGYVGETGDVTVIDCVNYGAISAGFHGAAGGIVGASAGVVEIVNCENDATITQLAFGAVKKEGEVAGGIFGAQYLGTLSVAKCVNYGQIVSGDGDGSGIVGWAKNEATSTAIDSCENYGDLDLYNRGGGIFGVGYAPNATVTNSTNYGDVDSEVNYCGGVVGRYGNGGDTVEIKGCINKGKVTSSGGRVAGILGYADGNITIDTCVNDGEIYTTVNTQGGGIFGQDTNGSSMKILNCVNNAPVTAKSQTGGIAGYISSRNGAEITNCINNGEVESTGNYAGGIIARFGSDAYSVAENKVFAIVITDCTNNGNVTSSKSQVAGMIAYLDGGAKIVNCVNEGDLTATTGSAGGIVGNMRGNETDKDPAKRTALLISGCVNNGDLVATAGSGGIVAKAGNREQVPSSNANAIVANFVVENSINNGNVTVTIASGNPQVAGIAGYAWGGGAGNKITGCINTGTVKIVNTGTGTGQIGAVVGYVNSGAHEVSNNINLGQIVYESTGSATAPASIALIGWNKTADPANSVNNASVEFGSLPLFLSGDPGAETAAAGKIYTEDEIKSGKAVYELNTAAGEIIFYQVIGSLDITLVGDDTNTVYFDGTNYTNTAPTPAP